MKSRAGHAPAPSSRDRLDSESIRTGLSADAIATALIDNLHFLQGRLPRRASGHDWYMALAYTVRDRLLHRCTTTVEAVVESNARAKLVAYLSAEYLTGPQLGNCLVNLGIWPAVREALSKLGQDLPTLLDEEIEPGLGNGGLGRVAACYMDSLATLNVPAIGYGIRYEFGIFDQTIRDGWQVELSDRWQRGGSPWELARADIAFDVRFGGHTESYVDGRQRARVRWIPAKIVKGTAYDIPVPGYRVPTTNVLRLWKADASGPLDLDVASSSGYCRALEQRIALESLSSVLCPSDGPEPQEPLRLAQHYFFVACSLQDMIRLHLMRGKRLDEFDSGWAAQLNDTDPSIAVAELMRLFVDDHGMNWEKAWTITQRTCGYTSHAVLPDALETWPVKLFGTLLPRHLEIVIEINRRFLDEVRARCPDDDDLLRRLSLIDESEHRSVRMAHMAAVGSHAINGVGSPHTEVLKERVLPDFHRVAPEKFVNVTSGATPRRWMVLGNPGLSGLITRYIGERWISRLEDDLHRLEPLATDAGFQHEWQEAKADSKRALADVIKARVGISVDVQSLFDVQMKRVHEYKRQHLNVLYLVTLYNRLTHAAPGAVTPRTVIFSGRAAPGYRMAKLIIKLINAVAGVVNADARVSDLLKVVFLPGFDIRTAQRVYPAADLSEQLSAAGKGESGTGHMKFAMNGALTIGTPDSPNAEIREAVGDDNFFMFGLTAAEIHRVRAEGYSPRRVYDANPELRQAIDAIADGMFSGGDRQMFRPLVEALMIRDEYMLFADYQAYVDCQTRVSAAFCDQSDWTRMSILNAARVGRFSSDRSIRDYCRDVWHVTPIADAR